MTKLTTSEGEHCTSGCLLDYDYFKRFRQTETFDADPKAIQQIEFVEQLEKTRCPL